MSSAPTVWYREFVRASTPDIDHVAPQTFMKANFTDPFGQSLFNADSSGIYTSSLLSEDELVNYYYLKTSNYLVQSFGVADGLNVTYRDEIASWFNSHLRFVHFVTPPGGPWLTGLTLFIVGSSHLKSTSAFLQVASWDRTIQEFRFYSREPINDTDTYGWIYFGKSSDAFVPATSYLGPFNGHVNGAIIMKEIHQPWIHWQGSGTPLTDCLSPEQLEDLSKYPYLSTSGNPLAALGVASTLENFVTAGVRNWFTRRIRNDFLLPDGKTPNPSPTNIQRWMAHVLLTTTINITAAEPGPKTAYTASDNVFINLEVLKVPGWGLIPNIPDLTFSSANYQIVVKNLDLASIQEVDPSNPPAGYITLYDGVLGGGKETDSFDVKTFVKALQGEGPFPFVGLQTSVEDATGMKLLFSPPSPVPRLLSQAALLALVTFDFQHPIYSWRRGVLWQYVPQSTTWDSQTSTYDFEETFINNIKESSEAGTSTSAEAQFLQLYQSFKNPDGSVNSNAKNAMKQRIWKYFKLLEKNCGDAEFLEKYFRFCESQRRIYRPLPLDEFGLTLPYALNVPQDAPWLELVEETADITEMDPRGVNFLSTWRSTLWGYDPHLIPASDIITTLGKEPSNPAGTQGDIPAIPGLHVSCSGAPRVHTGAQSAKKARGCPFMGRGWSVPDSLRARHLKTGM